MSEEREEERQRGLFPPTQWSLVGRAGESDAHVANPAKETLLGGYYNALAAHVGRKFGRTLGSHEVEDVVHGFVTDKLLQSGLLAGADKSRGRFRNYVATALDRYVFNYLRKRKKLQVSELVEDSPCDESDAPDAFHVEWACEVVNQAVAQMRAECEQARPDIWAVFELRLLRPLLHGEPEVPYDELAPRLGFASSAQASNALVTAKRTFRRAMQAVVERYVDSPSKVDAEIKELFEILQNRRAGS